MKKNSLIVVLAFLIVAQSFSQAPKLAWDKSVGGLSQDRGNGVAVDAMGNVYTTGVYNGTVDFDPGIGTYNLSSGGQFISKLDALGNFVWAKGINSATGLSITTDLFGNVYTTGIFVGTSDFDPGVGVFNLTSVAGSDDVFVSKLDASGNFIWAKSFGSSSSDGANAVTTDLYGNVYTTGSFQATTDFDPGAGVFSLSPSSSADLFISKLNTMGDFVWAKSIGASGVGGLAIGKGIKIDNLGNVFTTGQFQISSDFDPGAGTFIMTPASLSPDVFILKLDSLGNFIWAKQFSGANYDIAYAIDLDASGNVYTTGIFQNTVDFDPGAGVYNLMGSTNYNIFISKLDGSGNFVYAKMLASNFYYNQSKSIAVDASGNVYSTGLFSASVDFNPDTTASSTYYLTCVGSGSDIYISKLDNVGNFVWAKQLGGTDSEAGNSIAIDQYGNVYVAGEYRSVTMISDGITVTNADNTASTFDIFTSKLGAFQKVWPGDANNNYNVDNTDLLPIGLYYGQLGIPRDSISNVWQADSVVDWGFLQTNGFDIKHADCNGDSIINASDTLAINLNFSLVHAIAASNYNEQRLISPDIYFITSSSVYNPGDMVDVEVWVGSASNPVNNLYGLAFNINYDVSLVQPGSESLTFPVSWMGTPGANVIKIGKVDPLANTAYGALTRINHTNADGYGKIADFKFQAKTTLTTSSVLNLMIANYVANDSAGILSTFNTLSDSLLINVSSVGIDEQDNSIGLVISPNPNYGIFKVMINSGQKIENGQLSIYNAVGEKIYSKYIGQLNNAIVDLSGYANGVYFLKLKTESSILTQKIVINK